ncbi:MFS transporter [Rugosimonospora acidiphila]|uniref:MFS transporter n=2 Tax=Rugosimonospora acidiphila TaxID=556531 RepID=A0ABP9RNT1_9ACTN
MAILDVQVTNVAAPTIRTDLHASSGGLQLIITGYTIAYAMLLITGARLGDRLGHRRLFLGGLALFTAASLACGLAGSSGMLIGFRLVQGAGAALMIPQVFSLIQRQFHGRERMRALSLYGAVIAGGAIAGQVVGGVLVSADLWGTGWRPVFLINVPIGVVLLIAGLRALPTDHGEPGRGLDLPGLVVLSLAVLGFVVPLVFGHEEGWPLWGWLCLAGAAVLMAVFVAVERRARSPLIPGRVLRSPGMITAVITIFALMTSYGGFLFTLALHLQSGLGFSPLRAGLTFVPSAVCFAISSLNWRRMPPHTYHRMIPTGLFVGTLSLVLLLLSVRSGDAPGTLFYISQVIFGLGFGAAFSPLLTVALSHVAPSDAADASGLLTTVTQLGNVVGVATFGTLYLSQVATSPSGHAESLTSGVEALLTLVAGGLALLLPRLAGPKTTGESASLDTPSH